MPKAAPVGQLIRGLLQARGMDAKVREYHTWKIWDEAVGPQVASQARPVRIRDGVLEVRVAQPVWMQQLQLLKPKILARLNEHLTDATIRDIFLRRGKVDPAESAVEETRAYHRHLPELSAEERQTVEDTLGSLGDPELKEALGRVLSRQLRLEKSRRQD